MRVKLEAFPFTRYGIVTGRLVFLSRDAIEQEDVGLVFPARVELAPAHHRIPALTDRAAGGGSGKGEVGMGKNTLDEVAMAEPELNDNAAPPFLIELVEPIGYPRRAQVYGDEGARGLSAYHMVESVAHIVDAPLRYQVFYTSAETTPDVLTHIDSGEFRVVSQRLREVLEPWLKDYEFIPTHIELSPTDGHEETDEEDYSPQLGGGPVLENYWWLNCWRRLDLVDWRHSDIEMWRPPADSMFAQSPACAASGWKRLAMKAPPPEDENYFALTGIIGARHYISPKLYQHLLALDLKIKFAPRFLNAGAWGSTVEVTDKLNLGRQFSVFCNGDTHS